MNILVLTSVYPQEDDEKNIGVTPVVKYFAQEWVKAGHRVIVIHNSSRYPKFLYLLPDSLIKIINSKLGIVIPNRAQGKKLYSVSKNVPCYRLPMLKIFPKNKSSDRQIERQFNEIINILEQQKFNPDVIIGHWENPQVSLLSMLKRRFNVITAIVFHRIVYVKQKRYKRWAKINLNEIDVIGARSTAIANQVKELLSLKDSPFICYSGIPDRYFDNKTFKRIEFNKKAKNTYLYVGRLIKRKNIDVVLTALNKLYPDSEFNFIIVGEGAEKENLKSLSSSLNVERSVNFLGFRQRDEIIKIMDETEVFIMISDNETFGLVYIEAMSRGCIVIASKNGGMDGIIIHGYNGFLCEQGNESELVAICNKIKNMSLEKKAKISQNALKTALNFKDSEVAKKYLENVMNG